MNRWAQAAQRISSLTNLHMDRTVNEHVPQELFKATTDAIIRARNNEGTITTEDAAYIAGAKRVMKFMYECWINNKLCDMILNVAQGHQIHAHKLVLCAYSKSLVQECNQFPKGNVVSLDLKDFSKDIVLEMLYFVYTTKIKIHDGNLRGLVHLSIELDIDVLLQLCQNHLKTYDASNALSYYDIAQEIGLTSIMEAIQAFVCKNFTDVVVGQEFLTISVERLNSILADDRVVVITELEIFLAIIRWIDYDKAKRLQLAPSLMQHVRFAMIEPEILVTKVEVHEAIFEMRQCHNMLYQAMKFHALKLSGSALAGHFAPQQTRNYRSPNACNADTMPITTDDIIHHYSASPQAPLMPVSPVMSPRQRTMSFHHDTNHHQPPVVENYKPLIPPKPVYPKPVQDFPRAAAMSSELIVPHSRGQPSASHIQHHHIDHVGLPTPPRSPTSVNTSTSPLVISSLDSLIIPHHMFSHSTAVAVGGIDITSSDLDYPGRCLYKFDESHNSWSLLTMMHAYTHHHTAAVIENKIYVIGGIVPDPEDPDEPGHASDQVRMFDGEKEVWVDIAPMLQCRSYITAAVHKGCMYVCGGENESKMKLSTIEKYDSNFDKWTVLGNMQGGAKIGTATCVFRDCLYIVGGYNTGPVLADVECFDLVNNRWIYKQPLRVPRCHANLVVANNKMYLVGGRTQSEDGMSAMSSVAMYDESTDTWLHVADMTTPRLDCGCTAVGSKIFIIGGIHTPNPECLSLVEVYDTATEKWLSNVANLPQPTGGLACVTLA